uniref:H(+)-exporting diphosphatase n=1 Tax=Lotharella globosa TaxID=91324 RepID=A0A7S4DU26_9EUKA|mmetsp:Transcript_22586/g.43985  ORF Transcript_22586/g.43985 Transcript_22586/m.43985 type:complete len:822 (+) Transcript_22586:191-2656(+)
MVNPQNEEFDDGWLDLNRDANAGGAWMGGGLALIVAIIYAIQLCSLDRDREHFPQTFRIADAIAAGARAFLYREYIFLVGFSVVIGLVLLGLPGLGWRPMVSYWFGAILSAASGYIGMTVATYSNVLTTLACEPNEPGQAGDLNAGLRVAFKSGAVMALSVVSSALIGIAILYVAFEDEDKSGQDRKEIWEHIAAFAFGGSSVALFARVGGGIYTKAADVGADLVGKVEEDLPEDSPDNPATIADNVGDNVGDVAGMGADLFESYAGSIIAAATLGVERFGNAGIAFPFWLAGFGSIASIIGTMLVRTARKVEKQGDKKSKLEAGTQVLNSLLWSIRFAIITSSLLVLGLSWVALGLTFGVNHKESWRLFLTVLTGIICGNAIGFATEYATSYTDSPTVSIAEKSYTGPATVIIQGLGVGMLSTVPPVLFVVIAILCAVSLTGVYGIAVCAVAMLSTLGVTLATDAFGPVADNAGGIAEMSEEVDDATRDTTDSLDALGNTTAATGKGFAIGSAVLTALALLNAFADAVNLNSVNILDDVVLPGIVLGAALPFVFAALTMLSVGSAAEAIMYECRSQLNDKYFRGTELDSQKCVDICTTESVKEMVIPGVLSIFVPVVVGIMVGPKMLLGLLAGAISSGFLLAVMMSNAGGAWDNAKKYVGKGLLHPNNDHPKKTDEYKAVVVGDTVGDPFKDTSGPSLNILIKLMSVVSLVIAPLMTKNGGNEPKDTWEKDSWWIGFIVLIVLLIFIAVYYLIIQNLAQLHDKETIDAEAKKRKGESAKRKSVEMVGMKSSVVEEGSKMEEKTLEKKSIAGSTMDNKVSV